MKKIVENGIQLASISIYLSGLLHRLTLEGSAGRGGAEEFSVLEVRRLFRSLGFLLSYNTNVDDRHR